MKDCNISSGAAVAAPDRAPGTNPRNRGRKGKIARLPHAIREALNERLREGAPAGEIVDWLNGLPDVRATLQQRFGGAPITEQNIYLWRIGGFAGWLAHQDNKEATATMAAAGRNFGDADREALTSQLALSITAEMVAELRQLKEMPQGPLKSAAWRELVWSLVLLRRSDFYAGKLRLERDKLPHHKEAGEIAECAQQEKERLRQRLGANGPHWNNFTHQWEGEGADEMREKEEVERMVLEELRRRKAERTKN